MSGVRNVGGLDREVRGDENPPAGGFGGGENGKIPINITILP